MGPAQRAGWGFQILPYIEQDNLPKAANKTTIAEAQIQAMSTPVKTFFCPARRGPSVSPPEANRYGPAGTYPHALCDYAGSGGTGDNGAVVKNPGGANNMITLLRITDGTSNTIFAGDKRLNVGRINELQADDNEGYTCGWDHDVIRFTNLTPMPDPRTGDGEDRFGSSHSGGFVVSMCDGSVKFLRQSISATTFSALGTRSGGEVLGNDF